MPVEADLVISIQMEANGGCVTYGISAATAIYSMYALILYTMNYRMHCTGHGVLDDGKKNTTLEWKKGRARRTDRENIMT